ncbi:SOS response-associated peptidase [Gryllotalpicola protaetiae]|nr:SOS response-associated peptidase [Gryllotalpicola protaetiae]
MCGRFSMNSEVNESITEWVREGYRMEDWRPDRLWDPSWNIKPTQPIPLLFESAKGSDEPTPRFEPAHWSLVPSWSKTLKLKYPTFNARTEGITEKATWKGPLKSHRGIVLANGYYEWQTNPDGKTKTPYFIHHPEAPIIGFAGLYSWWPDPAKAETDEDRWTLTATILTSDAVQTLADIHDRNPVILPEHMWRHWIDATVTGDQALVDDAVAAGVREAEQLVFDQVAPLRGDGPQLVEPIAG